MVKTPYVLVQCGDPTPSQLNQAQVITVPINSMYAMIQFLNQKNNQLKKH